MSATTNVAVFGDLHGRVLLAFQLCARWQAEHGEPIQLALSVGDLGIYRSFQQMEKTSQRWARKHPEELGFSKFFFALDLASKKLARHPMVDAVLAATDAALYFVPGNHEEHAYLDELWRRFARAHDAPIAVDRAWVGLSEGRYAEDEHAGHGRIRCLPQGPIVELPLEGRALRVHAVNGLDAYTRPEAWAVGRGPVDVLLSHETYEGRLRGSDRSGLRDSFGSRRLLELIRAEQPRYHFFGHHHRFFPELELGPTRSVGLNQVYFEDHQSLIAQGCMGVLRIAGEAIAFELVEDPWFQALRYAECAPYL